MGHFYRWTFAFLVCALTLASDSACARSARILSIPDGTPIAVHSMYDISTRDVRTGDTVLFVTEHPLVVDGVTLIEAGAPVRGAAIVAEGAGVGHRGQLLVSVDSVQAVDGVWIPLRMRSSSKDSAQLMVPVHDEKLGRVRFPNGRDKVLPTTLTLKVYVDQTQSFALVPSGDGSAPRLVLVSATPIPSAHLTTVKLPGGTPVVVRLTHTVSSDGERTGREVDFVVCEPVKIDGYTVIARGANARGTVLLARHSSLIGARGELALNIDRVQATDGSMVAVSFAQYRSGGGSVASSVMPPGLPTVASVATAFLPGSHAVVSKRRRLVAYVHDDCWFATEPGVDKATAKLAAVPPTRLRIGELGGDVSEARSDELLSLRTSGTTRVAGEGEMIGASFHRSSPTIYATWTLKPCARAREFDVVWLRSGRPYERSQAFTLAAGDTRGQASLPRPAGGFPEGHWAVVLQSNGRILGLQNFEVTR